jgi:HD superfamily phosphohydrolase
MAHPLKLSTKEILYRDEVHGDIRLDALAVSLLNTSAVQRLGRVYQLGYAHLVYRGGTHTRLSHVLGAYHVAGELVDALRRNYSVNPRSWPTGVILPEDFLPGSGDDAIEDRWLVLRLIVGWAALLHDLGHIPLGHTLEDEFAGIFKKHDSFESPRMPYLWHETSPGNDSEIKQIFQLAAYPEQIRRMKISSDRVWQTVMCICLHKEGVKDGSRVGFGDLLRSEKFDFVQKVLLPAHNAVIGKYFFPYMADIVANTICADYLDYMQRDPQNLGLDALHDDRVISQFWIGREGKKDAGRDQYRMALSLVDRRGKPRLDTTTGVVDLVRQRYRFAEIIYYHKTKAAASAMLAKAFQLLGLPKGADDVSPSPAFPLTFDDIGLRVAALQAEGAKRGKGKLSETLAQLKAEVLPFALLQSELDLLDPHLGDESMMLALVTRAWAGIEKHTSAGEWQRVEENLHASTLISHIMHRRLFKVSFTLDKSLFQLIKPGGTESAVVEEELPDLIRRIRRDVDFRSMIEAKMAQAVNWPAPAFILYVPPLKSQAKGIETRALNDGSVTTLGKHSAVRDEVQHLSDKYTRLWRMIAFVHPDYADKPIDLSTAVDELVRAMFADLDPEYNISPKVQTHLSGAAWFDYIPRADRPAAKMYLPYTTHLQKLRWGMRALVEARSTIEGSASDMELVNRALLFELASTGGASLESVRGAVEARYPEPESVTAALSSSLGSQLELREGAGEADQRVEGLRRLADELRSALG